jgi:uncharacterized protein DUF6968
VLCAITPQLAGASRPCRCAGGQCNYEIDWPEGKETMTAWGFDSVQALVVALQMIGAELYSSSYHKSGKLMLEAPGNGYGFPVVSSLRDMLEGEDAKIF